MAYHGSPTPLGFYPRTLVCRPLMPTNVLFSPTNEIIDLYPRLNTAYSTINVNISCLILEFAIK